MTKKIGEKIKALRKELNLTQSQLAGKEMTKSMLSQIENNQASPSMKNLQYLATSLNKPISYFLDENSEETVNPLPINEINSVIIKASSLFEKMDFSACLRLLESLLQKYNLDKNDRLYAEVLYLTGKCLVHLKKFNEGEKNIQKAFDLFIKNHLYTEAAKAYIEFCERYFACFNYEKCLELLTKVEDIYNCSSKKDVVFEINLLYTTAIINYSMGNVSDALNLIHKSINLAKETGIYYKVEGNYRLAAKLYLFISRYDDFLFCIEKASLFAKFADDKQASAMIALHMSVYENEMNNPKAALNQLKTHEENIHKLTYVYFIEKAKSYYSLNEYETALENLKMVDYSSYANSRTDYLEMWSSKIYEGLILHKLGKSSEAIEVINEGIKKLEIFKNTKHLALAYKSLSEIYSDIGNYLEAFRTLKIADEIKNALSKE